MNNCSKYVRKIVYQILISFFFSWFCYSRKKPHYKMSSYKRELLKLLNAFIFLYIMGLKIHK